MAFDTVIDKEQLEGAITASANAIRGKTGSTEMIPWDASTGFADAISAIETGGGGGGGGDSALDALLDASITEVTSNASSVKNYAFYMCKKLTKVTLPNATSFGSYSFANTMKLFDVYGPKVNKINANCFTSSMIEVAIFTDLTSIDANAFSKCYNFYVLVIRGSAICSLANVNAFTGTCIAEPDTSDSTWDGRIFVPAANVATYQAATNWSTFSDRFRALESYTVDGTTTGALDWDKVNY